VNRILLPLLMALTLTACSSPGPVASIEDRNQPAKTEGVSPSAKTETTAPTAEATATDKGVETTALPAAGGASAGGSEGKPLEGGVTVSKIDPRKDPASPLSKRSIYFDYDSDAIKDDYRPLVEAHAAYLVSHKDAKIVLQGNTDDRGSREYNLALGQRRAEAVRKAMLVLGAGDVQLEAVSFGKEKPRATGDTEQAYAENRRVDIVYLDEN
jgi:peptidoglycan-associated lipoprotein